MRRKIETKPKRSIPRQIINAFIGIFAVIVTILIIFFGFSQTRTFREYLREEIISTVNTSVKGKLSIEKIDGSVLTSLILRNTTLTADTDTVVSAKKISLKLKPHKILFDIIYVRELIIEDINVNLLEDESGELNLNKALRSADVTVEHNTTEAVDDNDGSPFPYSIQVAELDIKNLDLVNKSSEFVGNNNSYDIINWDDLEVENFNLSAALNLDLKNSAVTLRIHDLAASPNLNKFKLNHLSGLLSITSEYASVENLVVKTDSSDIALSARLNGINLFGSVDLENFEFYPVRLNLNAQPFCFDDITAFIGATKILKGTPRIFLDASGEFGNINIENLGLQFLNTQLNLNGSVQNLHTPEDLFIDAALTNSSILQTDASELLPSIGIPRYQNLRFKSFEAKFTGQPNNFYSEIHGELSRGKIDAYAELNFQTSPFSYDIDFSTERINLKPIINTLTDITSEGKVKGIGVTLGEAVSDIELYLYDSRLNIFDIDSLVLTGNSNKEFFTADLYADLDEGIFDIDTRMNFPDTGEVQFLFDGVVNNLDLAEVTLDTSLASDLNINFDISGTNFDLNEIQGEFLVDLMGSKIQDREIDSSKVELQIDFSDPQNKKFEMTSEMLDIEMAGKFEFNDFLKLIEYESNLVAELIINKLSGLNPLSVISDSTTARLPARKIDKIVYSDISTATNFQFKNSKLTDFILGGEKLNLQCGADVIIKNDTSDFSISADILLDNFTRISNGKPLYLSDFELYIDLNRNNLLSEFDDLFASFSVTGKRLYTGTEFNNIGADLIFNQDKMYFNLVGEIDTTLSAEVDGNILLMEDSQTMNIDRLNLDYNHVLWENPDTIKMNYSKRMFELENFELVHNFSKLKLDGRLYNFGGQNFELSAENISAEVLGKYLKFLDDDDFHTNVSLSSIFKGSLQSPEIQLIFIADSIGYRNNLFGSINCNLNYAEKKLSTDISFLENLANLENPKLLSTLRMPIDLSFGPVEERLISDRELEIKIKSQNFDLRSFGNALPLIRHQEGEILTDLTVTGTYDDLNYSGYLEIPGSFYNFRFNNLDYNFASRFEFNNSEASITSLKISNSGDTRYSGTLNGTGKIIFEGFIPSTVSLALDGDLAIMGQKSKLETSLFYGDLLVRTDGDLNFDYSKEKSSLAGNILINEADLVYLTQQESIGDNQNELIYTILVDSSQIDREEIRFKELFASEEDEGGDFIVPNFNYELDFTVVDDARLVFIMPDVVNQRLVVEATGGFRYASIDGIPRAQGEILLLEGSQLEFFKNFDASGSLRFESELSNPYLNISALYKSNYEPEQGTIEEVGVNINITGPLNQLAQNFTSQAGNFQVFYGADNIQNRVPETKYDFSDAITFLLVNKFKNDLKPSDQNSLTNDLALSATTTIAGTFLSNLVNSSVGGFINNIQVDRIKMDNTKDENFFNDLSTNLAYTLSGRYKNLRYSFGGYTRYGSKLNKANLKIEYLFNPNFSVRLERRSSINFNIGADEQINEFALKYKFEF